MVGQRRKQFGYTLIELLVYVSIVGGLLMAITYFFGVVVDARVKNQTIAEVNDQGEMLMDYITQAIRSATSVTTPTLYTASSTLSLVVPTGSLSPTVFSSTSGSGTVTLGYSTAGTSTDTSNSNFMNATKFTASATGTIATLYANIGATVSASPNNTAQMAIYSGASTPTTLLAKSASVTLTANAWNTFAITPVFVTGGQTYWLAYNTNGLTSASNDLKYHAGTTGQSQYLAQTFGTWPTSWASNTPQNDEFSMFGQIDLGGGIGTVQVKEGTGAQVPLTNSNIQVRALTFRNSSQAGAPSVIQVSFTLSRINPSNKNEYDYQKTFTGSAEVQW